jgi:hypothetical protein
MSDRPELIEELNIPAPDEFYAALMDIHRGLSDAQSRLADAKLILLLANQVGDMGVLRRAIQAAREGVA